MVQVTTGRGGLGREGQGDGGPARTGHDGTGRGERPLRVVVTRAERQAGPLVSRLEALGCDVLVCPLVRVEPIGDAPVDAAPYDWVVVTSPNGASELARRLRSRPARLAAIGPGTAAELRAHGLDPDLVPAVSTQEGLLAELPQPAGRVLVAAAAGARRLLADELGADFLPLYRTVELAPESPPAGDLVLLASASAARALAAAGARIPVVAIGPQTAATARELGLDVAAEAETHDLDGLVAAVERFLPTR
jgi:uroporphyrinogen-III synthase